MSPKSEHRKLDALVSTIVAAELTGVPAWWIDILLRREDIPYEIIRGRKYVSLKAVEKAVEEDHP